jgi:hypothetical protein
MSPQIVTVGPSYVHTINKEGLGRRSMQALDLGFSTTIVWILKVPKVHVGKVWSPGWYWVVEVLRDGAYWEGVRSLGGCP